MPLPPTGLRDRLEPDLSPSEDGPRCPTPTLWFTPVSLCSMINCDADPERPRSVGWTASSLLLGTQASRAATQQTLGIFDAPPSSTGEVLLFQTTVLRTLQAA